MTVPEVSTARDHDRDSLYCSPGNGTGAPEGRNIDYMDKAVSHREKGLWKTIRKRKKEQEQ
jgi:hypothetical protein